MTYGEQIGLVAELRSAADDPKSVEDWLFVDLLRRAAEALEYWK